MRGSRVKKLKKASSERPNPGRKHGGSKKMKEANHGD